MKISIGETVWMVDGTRLSIVRATRKLVIVEDGRKILHQNLNRQYSTQILLELQDGVWEFKTPKRNENGKEEQDDKG